VLQPVIYSLVVEQALGETVSTSRLFYCTSAGGFQAHDIALTDRARRAGLEALEIIDRAIEIGFLAAAPAAGSCGYCDFRPVCGPHEEQRVARKSQDPLADLGDLRGRL
jgi:CRISPR/Cas system-associated exonuclease Cas4 (RecB family)